MSTLSPSIANQLTLECMLASPVATITIVKMNDPTTAAMEIPALIGLERNAPMPIVTAEINGSNRMSQAANSILKFHRRQIIYLGGLAFSVKGHDQR